MDIPKYDEWYLPLLRLLVDGKVHPMSEVFETLADQAGLDAVTKAQLLPSGTSPTYRNRIGWARTYLKQAGLLRSPARSQIELTPRGFDAVKELQRQGLQQIDNAWLDRYPEFVEWRRRSIKNPGTVEDDMVLTSESSAESPTDTMERVYSILCSDLASELLERVKQAPPTFFEKIVVDLMLAMGYGGARENAGRTVGRTGDGGIDGVIDEDRLGLDKIYLQAKRWESSVGRPVVQAFSGSLDGERATKGVLITTSSFSKDAVNFVRKIAKKIVLIDGRQLAELMIQHNVGVSVENTYTLKRVDGDYFEPE